MTESQHTEPLAARLSVLVADSAEFERDNAQAAAAIARTIDNYSGNRGEFRGDTVGETAIAEALESSPVQFDFRGNAERGDVARAIEAILRAVESQRPLTDTEAQAYCLAQYGDAPASRYGRTAWNWAPVAYAYALCMAHHTGELSTDSLDSAISAVVNDSEAPAELIASTGPAIGIDPGELLESQTVADGYLSDGANYGDRAEYLATAIIDHIARAISAGEFDPSRWAERAEALADLTEALESITEDVATYDLAEAFADIIAANLAADTATTRANLAQG